MKLKDKVVVITGGAMGIGEASARLFADEGASVVIGDLADEAALEVVSSIKDTGGQALQIHVDVSRPNDIEALFSLVHQNFNGVDILINNAGIALAKSSTDTTLEEWDRIIKINLTGAWLCAKLAVPQMIKRGGGAIVNVASNAGLVGFPNLAAYCASKGGMIQLTKAMALDLASSNIRVNAVCPGHTRTPMGDGFIAAQQDPVAFVKEFINVKHPLGRMAEADEVARTILFLASQDASFVTGAVLAVDGGYTAQ